MEHFEIVHLEQMLDARQRVIAQMLMIDGIVLKGVEKADEVVQFGNERTAGRQHIDDAVDDRVHVLDVGEAVRGSDDAGRPMLAPDLACDGGAEITLDGRDAALAGDVADVGRLDAQHAMAAVLKVRQERAVVGADIVLQLIAGVFGVLAAVGYGILCRRLNLRTLLVGCMVVATAANLGYLFYSSAGRAQAIEGLNGFGYTLAELALMDLAVRSTPAGSEGLGFSLMVSVRNLALFGTDWFGSKLLDQYHFSFDSLVIANSATTLIAVPLVFLLPRLIVLRKDAEIYEPAPAPKAMME